MRRWLALVWLGGIGAAAAAAAEPEATTYHLYAHRGGVVEDKFPDNSAAAFQAAVDRGYAGVEIDIRETSDGVLVTQHDRDLKLNFGDARNVHETTWKELQVLRSGRENQPLWRFEDVVAAARAAGLRLMLDSKNPHGPDFCAKVEAILRRYDMLEKCVVIGSADALEHFVGKAPVGLKARSLQPKLAADPGLAKHYVLFDEGSMTEATVRWAQALGLTIIPSINTQHYYDATTMNGKSREELAPVILAAAKRDIDKFMALGVTTFQIDSEFDRWFPATRPSAAP